MGISGQVPGVGATLKNDLHSTVTSELTCMLLALRRLKVFWVCTATSSDSPTTSASSALALQVRGDTERENRHSYRQREINNLDTERENMHSYRQRSDTERENMCSY